MTPVPAPQRGPAPDRTTPRKGAVTGQPASLALVEEQTAK